MVIAIVFDSAQELGGYRHHNPFRLYTQNRLKKIVDSVRASNPLFMISQGARSSPSDWCSGVIVAQRDLRHEIVIDDRKDAHAWVYTTKIDGLIAVKPKDKLTGYVANVVKWALAESVAVTVISPEDMPADYRVAALAEEVRGAIPEDCTDTLDKAIVGIQHYIDSKVLTEQGRRRAQLRISQFAQLKTLIEELHHRA